MDVRREHVPRLDRGIGRYDDHEWADAIEADVLVLLGEDEHFFDNRLGHDFTCRLTGACEGNVNRLKALKRQMFGRAGLDLLRKRAMLLT
ncbi:hypothetical protein ABZ897_27535 [Nonomuraea sp. NPDC046802]|uniref:hypothetical protein n=1 Tax=Nonomuraea sp. NPDC046802 TaxID=3154919 RepID=UPI0033CC3C41